MIHFVYIIQVRANRPVLSQKAITYGKPSLGLFFESPDDVTVYTKPIVMYKVYTIVKNPIFALKSFQIEDPFG